jgi:hypothetical protein
MLMDPTDISLLGSFDKFGSALARFRETSLERISLIREHQVVPLTDGIVRTLQGWTYSLSPWG